MDGREDDDTIPRIDARLCALAAEARDAELRGDAEAVKSLRKRIDYLLGRRFAEASH